MSIHRSSPLKLKDETPFFVHPYPMREEQERTRTRIVLGQIEHLDIIQKGLTSFSSLVVLVK